VLTVLLLTGQPAPKDRVARLIRQTSTNNDPAPESYVADLHVQWRDQPIGRRAFRTPLGQTDLPEFGRTNDGTLLASDKSPNSFDCPTTPKLTTSQIYEVGTSLPKEAVEHTVSTAAEN
jgi:hypothetical protein